MKHSISFVSFLFLALSTIGCTVTPSNSVVPSVSKDNNNKDEILHQNITVRNWDVDLSNAKFGRVYKLNPMVKPTGNTIAGFAISDTLSRLTQEQKHVIHFVLMSKSFYNDKTESPVKTLFAPYLAISFVGHNRPADFLLISYGGEEWALATKEKIIKKLGFKNKSALIDFGLSILPNDEYLESIK